MNATICTHTFTHPTCPILEPLLRCSLEEHNDGRPHVANVTGFDDPLIVWTEDYEGALTVTYDVFGLLAPSSLTAREARAVLLALELSRGGMAPQSDAELAVLSSAEFLVVGAIFEADEDVRDRLRFGFRGLVSGVEWLLLNKRLGMTLLRSVASGPF